MYSFHVMETILHLKSCRAIPNNPLSESANMFSPCHTYMYQIQKHLRNDLSNPISTDLGGEIDVSFIYFFLLRLKSM